MNTVKVDLDDIEEENNQLKAEREKIESLYVLGIHELTPRPDICTLVEESSLKLKINLGKFFKIFPPNN